MNTNTPWVALAAALLLGCEEAPRSLSLGAPTEEPGPAVADTLASSLREAGFEVEVEFFEHGSDLLAALAAGSLQLAIVEEPARPRSDVTVLLPLYPAVLHIMSRDPAATTLTEALQGSVYAGPVGSLGRRLAEELAESLQVSDLRLLDDPWTETPSLYFVFGGLLTAMAARQLEGFALLDPGGPKHRDGESIVDAIALRHPNLRPFTLPAHLYPALSDDPVRTLAVTTLLAAGPGVDANVAYEVTAHLIENSRAIRAVYPLAHTTSANSVDLESLAVPLHAGTRRYINRDRPGLLQRYVDIIALLTTLVLAAASAGLGWIHSRKRARKERIDRYLTAVLDVREGLRSARCDDWRGKLDRVEQAVLELVVAEKIEIDAGLIAFLQLAGSVRGEANGTLNDAGD